MNFKNAIEQKLPRFWQQLKSKAGGISQLRIYEARTSILLWYVALMGLFIAIAIPTIRYRLIAEVTERVEEDMREELEEFEEELIESLLESNLEADPEQTASERANSDISLAFDRFISTNEAEDDNYFITIVEGSFYKTNASSLPKPIASDSNLMQHWQQLEVEEEGEVETDVAQVGSVLYKAEPIKTTEEVIGVFVVVHFTAGERKEVINSFYTVVQVLLVAIALALLMAWLAAGRVLAPLRHFSQTLQSISESDLSQRIQVKGRGELAQLSNTFNAMMDRIEDSFAIQRNFINDAGHELRTPITIIRGHLELMDENIDPQCQGETVELVIDELDRMTRLVEDLVILAKEIGRAHV